jgi:PAS domain S-box-containing protein
MKHNLSKYLVCLLLFFTLGKSMAILPAGPNADLLANDTITIASEPDYPPYCIVDENGQADGFSVELFKAAAEAAGLEVKIKIGIWNQIMHDLAKGKIDALPLVGRTPEREELFDFTMPYLSLHGAVFVRKGTENIQSVEDLKNKKVLVMKGDNAEEFVRREKITDEIIAVNTFEEAFRQLSNGRYDALITQRIMGLELIKKMNINNLKALDFQLPRFRQDFCFAVKKGDHHLLNRLNEGLSIIIANDTYDELKLNWFGPEENQSPTFSEILNMALWVLIPLAIVMVLIWIVALRKEVKRQTKSLKLVIEEYNKALTALKLSEETYRNLFQNAQVGLFRTRISDGKILESNEQLAKMFGFDNRHEIIAEYMTSKNYVDDGTREKMLAEIRDKGYIQNFEARFYRRDRSVFWANYSAKINKEQGWIEGVAEDITKRKETENELRKLKNKLEEEVAERTSQLQEKVQKLDKSQKAMLFMVEDLNRITAALKEERRKLEYSNRELEAFTYSVSHDLRAPLRAINGFSKFLAEDYAEILGEEGNRFIDTIRSNATKMDQLITDMLNLSRVARADMILTEVDMKAIIGSVYQEVATEEEKQQFTLTVDEMPLVKCDPSLIKQVWQNLIGNALKYSSTSKNKKIEVFCKKENDSLTYCIQDHGAGFNNQYVDKIFGIFQRLHKESEFEGSGVGLAIVQRIIHRHGGSIHAEGKINRGAKLCFTLPVN